MVEEFFKDCDEFVEHLNRCWFIYRAVRWNQILSRDFSIEIILVSHLLVPRHFREHVSQYYSDKKTVITQKDCLNHPIGSSENIRNISSSF